jgi:hypothetical protein
VAGHQSGTVQHCCHGRSLVKEFGIKGERPFEEGQKQPRGVSHADSTAFHPLDSPVAGDCTVLK